MPTVKPWGILLHLLAVSRQRVFMFKESTSASQLQSCSQPFSNSFYLVSSSSSILGHRKRTTMSKTLKPSDLNKCCCPCSEPWPYMSKGDGVLIGKVLVKLYGHVFKWQEVYTGGNSGHAEGRVCSKEETNFRFKRCPPVSGLSLVNLFLTGCLVVVVVILLRCGSPNNIMLCLSVCLRGSP